MALRDYLKSATAISAISAIPEPRIARIARIAIAIPANPAPQPELFQFAPPGDPANDGEALAERAAIMGVENGWNEATALQEARWQADRERCWRAFLSNAERVLARPEHEHKALLRRYEDEATRRYGKDTGAIMVQSLTSWIAARAVH